MAKQALTKSLNNPITSKDTIEVNANVMVEILTS
jgi:hypothetical protein